MSFAWGIFHFYIYCYIVHEYACAFTLLSCFSIFLSLLNYLSLKHHFTVQVLDSSNIGQDEHFDNRQMQGFQLFKYKFMVATSMSLNLKARINLVILILI